MFGGCLSRTCLPAMVKKLGPGGAHISDFRPEYPHRVQPPGLQQDRPNLDRARTRKAVSQEPALRSIRYCQSPGVRMAWPDEEG